MIYSVDESDGVLNVPFHTTHYAFITAVLLLLVFNINPRRRVDSLKGANNLQRVVRYREFICGESSL